MLIQVRPSVSTRWSLPALLALLTVTACTGARSDVRVRCHTAFDTDFFYIAADVEKPVLRGSVSIPFGDPLGDDAFLIGLAVPDSPDRRVEMAVSVAQGAQLYRGAARRPLRGIDDFLTAPDGTRMVFKYRLRPKGKLNAVPDFANGFTVEMAIPWLEMGGPPRQGERLRFIAAVSNTVEGEAPMVALSPKSETLELARDTANWGEIVFVDAPTSSVVGAPGAVVCARVYNVKPVIDGVPADGEWSRITAFAFGSGMEAAGGTPVPVAAARSRAPLALQPAPPAPAEGRWQLSTAAAEPRKPIAVQAWPRLVFARYLVDRQADLRKPLPPEPAADSDGRSHLITHPMDGTGPWMSYDRIDWHRIQMTRMREAGVDVAAVTYRPGRAGRLAVTALGSALATLESADADRPYVCLWVDAGSLQAPNGDVAPALYAAIREFHQCLPPRLAATVPLSEANGGGVATPIIISGLDSLKLDPAGAARLRDDLRGRFFGEVGRDAVILSVGNPEGWDGGVAFGPGGASASVPDNQHYVFDSARPIRVASIYAGTRPTTAGDHPILRRSRETYRTAWRKAITDCRVRAGIRGHDEGVRQALAAIPGA